MSCQVLLLIASMTLLNAFNASARSLHPQHGSTSPGARLQTKAQLRSAGGSKVALGSDKLRQIKRNSGFAGTIQELATKLDSADDLVVDTSIDAMFHECTGLMPPDDVVAAASALDPGVIDPTLTVQQAFSLHSRPSAQKKLLLDFDGHVAVNTMLNSPSRPTITVRPYDTDGNPGSWSASELSDIVAIWRAVAEDYSAFDVDVTTEDQAGGAVAYTDMMRAAIGGSWQDWYNRTAAGLCFLNTFGRADGSPCYIFAKNLGSAKAVWEAVSHELGHSLGLDHDGLLAHDSQAAQVYYSGQGDWAPIMGVSYGKQITQFDKCEYAHCNNNQDDYAVISRHLPLLNQTNGKDVASATPMSITSPPAAAISTFTTSGLITQQGVPEVFSFSLPAAPAGSATPSAACTIDLVVPVPFGKYNRANLNAVVTVMDAAGAVVATFDPAGASPANGLGIAGASVTLPVAAAGGGATLFLVSVAGAQVDGISSYGSRGQYELSVACSPPTATPPPSPSPSPSPSPDPSPSPSPSPDPSPSPSPDPSPSSSPSPDPSTSPQPNSQDRSQPLAAAISFSLRKARSASGYTCTVTVKVTDSTTGAAITSALVQGSWYAPATKYASSISGMTAGGQLQASISKLPLSRSSCRAFIGRVALPPGYVAASSSSPAFDRRLSW